MPYIIRSNKPGRLPVAVATIEEAREEADRALKDALSAYDAQGEHPSARDLHAAAMAMPETGGVIGPLPDGYVIEVHHLRWDELRELLPPRDTPIIREIGDAGQPLIDAYNEAFGD